MFDDEGWGLWIALCLIIIEYIVMAYIKELIESLFDEESEGNIESFKKLIYLTVNETKIFAPYALELANIICPILHCIDDNTTKIYTLQLLSELATNYKEQIPPSTYDFPQIIALLSDENAEVRKASHYLLLIFIKKYERIDEIIKGYSVKVRENPDQWKQIQKIIHSFQSLLVIEPKCITYPENYAHLDEFMRMVIAFRLHQHQLIQKASEQTVASFVKNEYASKVLPKLNKIITGELLQIAEKLGINLVIKPNNEPSKPESRKVVEERKANEIEALLDAIQEESDWKLKSDIIEQISRRLQGEKKFQIPQILIERMLDFTYDYNFKICITAMNILYILITNYPHECAPKYKKIEDIMIEKICDLKMAVRQIASKILRKIFSNSSKDSAKKVFGKLATCSVIGKEQILTFIQDYYTSVIPSDLGLVLGQVATQLSNENTKIKIKTLDCLVKISLSCNIDQCKYILQKKLNKVYYDMFLDRLKERGALEAKQEKWDDSKNNNLNKGMTWQAERSPNLVEPGYDKNLTKVQFSKKSQRPPQEDTMYDFKFEAPTFGGALQKRQQTKSKGIMMGTSHTSNETYSSYDARIDDSANSKFSKKSNVESYRPSALSNFQTVEQKAFEEKKLPLKPKPIKKSMTSQTFSQEGDNLVIQSKQYQNKNTYEQIKEEKSVKQMKLTRKREQKIEKIEVDNTASQQRTAFEKSNKEPFSIKKSTSKKDHQIDYKATQYVSKEQLAPVSNPKELLRQITSNISKDSEWSKQFDSLDGLRRLIKNHEDIYPLIQQNLAIIMPEVLKLVESLRSSLAKNGMITLAEMCQTFKKCMDPFLQAIFIKLFKKAQDTNSFIIQQVNKCIKSLCTYCTNAKVLPIVINNSQTKSIPIKLKVAFCMDKLLEKDNYSLIMLRQNQKLLGVMGNYITDSCQEVRGLTKDIFINILANNSLNQVEGVFRKSPKEIWQKWRGIIDRDLK